MLKNLRTKTNLLLVSSILMIFLSILQIVGNIPYIFSNIEFAIIACIMISSFTISYITIVIQYLKYMLPTMINTFKKGNEVYCIKNIQKVIKKNQLFIPSNIVEEGLNFIFRLIIVMFLVVISNYSVLLTTVITLFIMSYILYFAFTAMLKDIINPKSNPKS